jgi:succinate dehydrogenase / fumarate reductase flavoprotein subunit
MSPANRRKFRIIVVGSGLAGGSAAATLGELGYNVDCFAYQDSPRRAHSVSAQGGINAAKNYRNDGDSIFRLFYDTVKGGDYRSREANVYRLAQVSNNIIDQCVAQGVPFAREYGGLLDNRSFGGAQVSRTFYARGQTGQQLLLGAYQALARQIHAGRVRMHTRTEMLDLVVVNGVARGIVTRDLRNGKIERWLGDAVVLATGGYSNAFYLSTCIPQSGEHQSKLTLMSESLRNDGRIWAPRQPGDTRAPGDIPEKERWYYLEERYPSFGNLVPRDIASRAAKSVVDAGHGVGPRRNGVYLDFADAIERLGVNVIRDRYGNLFDMYENITGENPYEVPMRIYPALHYTMGGLWVDYNLMSTIPGMFAIGEANFSDHGANRLGASALMQGLADGYFILPYTLSNYLAQATLEPLTTDHEAFRAVEEEVHGRVERLLKANGDRSVDSYHRELGQILWEYCGMERSEEGLKKALELIPPLREEYWQNVRVPGDSEELNQSLEKAGRVGDFMELAELMCIDALHRNESCGAHFRSEYQTADGEARRDDENYAYVAAWQYAGDGRAPILNKEPLTFEYVALSQRSYK